MQDRIHTDRIHIDHVHSLAICTEIGDRLREMLSKDQSEIPASIEARLSRLRELEVDLPSIVPPIEQPWFARR